jgi:amino acid transporter
VNSLKQIIKKINFLKVTEILVVVAIMIAPVVGFAALSDTFRCDPTSGLNCTAGGTINGLIRTVINWLLGIAFGIAVLFLIIGGFWYITSAGNEETAEKGKNTAINAIIGIVIIILSYVIVNVVSNLVSNGGGNTGP